MSHDFAGDLRYMSKLTPTPQVTPADRKAAWRCFHCDEVFTERRCAASHFGADESATPACKIDTNTKPLIDRLRDAETACADAMDMMATESTDAARAYYAQRTRHNQQLRDVEQAAYDQGLFDGLDHSFDEATLTRIAHEGTSDE